MTGIKHRTVDERWYGLSVCLVAGFMTLLDVSIVNVALPSMREGLHAGDNEIQWIVAGYSLAYGIVLVPAGRLGDARSRRNVFGTGLVVFTVASACAGAAPTALILSIARIAQGVGGGLIAPQVSGFIQNLFQGEERGRAFGAFGATIGLSTATGPLLGGILVGIGGPDLGWRYVFYVNVPIGIIAFVLSRKWLPSPPPGKLESLDPVGVLLFTTVTFLVFLPLVVGHEGAPLSTRPWWLIAVAAPVFVVFVLWEKRWHRSGKTTLVDLSLVKVRSYVLGLGLGTAYFAGFTSIFLVLTLFLQNGRHYSALQAGLTQMPFAVASGIAAIIGGRLVGQLGRRLIVLGLVMVITGLIAIDQLTPHLDSDLGLKLAPFLFLTGFGGGLVVSPNVTMTLADVDPARAGSGGGMLQTAQRVGSSMGIALVLAQFFSQLAASRGDFDQAFTVSLRTTIVFVIIALVLGIGDLAAGRNQRRVDSP